VERVACVNLDGFPLQLLLRRRSRWNKLPAAVERARARRILPGMRYAAALSLSSALRAGVVADTEIEENVSTLAEGLRFFTSDVEPSAHEPGVFWLGAAGLSLLYPSLKKWGGLIHNNLAEAGFRSAVAVGFSRFGTYVVSKTSGGVTVFDDPVAEKAKASRAPIERLGVDPNLRDSLIKLGITTLGRFLNLPASGILRRFGAEVLHLHQLANGELWTPLQPDIPVEAATGRVALDYPETNLDRLMAVIGELLGPIRDTLARRDELIAALEIRFIFDNKAKHTERLEPAGPTLDLPQILELVRLRLEKVSLPSGVTDIDLETAAVHAHRRQRDLFEKLSPRELGAANRALARIRAEFGEDAVKRARLRDGHLPEACFEWVPAKNITPPAPRHVAVRPLVRRIYAQPVPFSKTRHREPKVAFAHMYEDRLVEETIGPYTVAGGWWVREVQREYYFVRTESGRWLWLYYDRRRTCWFLHGEVE